MIFYIYVQTLDYVPNTSTCSEKVSNILWIIENVCSVVFAYCWVILLLIHIKICNEINYDLNEWIDKIENFLI